MAVLQVRERGSADVSVRYFYRRQGTYEGVADLRDRRSLWAM